MIINNEEIKIREERDEENKLTVYSARIKCKKCNKTTEFGKYCKEDLLYTLRLKVGKHVCNECKLASKNTLIKTMNVKYEHILDSIQTLLYEDYIKAIRDLDLLIKAVTEYVNKEE